MLIQRISLNNFNNLKLSSFNIHALLIVRNNYKSTHFFQTQQRIKFLSTTQSLASQIGRKPITYPPEVTITHDPTLITQPRVQADLFSTTLTISGPLGTHSIPIKPYIKLIFHEKKDSKEKNGKNGKNIK